MTSRELKAMLPDDDTEVSLYITIQVPRGEKVVTKRYCRAIADVKTKAIDGEYLIVSEV